MKDPEEKDQQQHSDTSKAAETQSDVKTDANWDKNQQVDEEGNQVDPEDVK